MAWLPAMLPERSFTTQSHTIHRAVRCLSLEILLSVLSFIYIYIYICVFSPEPRRLSLVSTRLVDCGKVVVGQDYCQAQRRYPLLQTLLFCLLWTTVWRSECGLCREPLLFPVVNPIPHFYLCWAGLCCVWSRRLTVLVIVPMSSLNQWKWARTWTSQWPFCLEK